MKTFFFNNSQIFPIFTAYTLESENAEGFCMFSEVKEMEHCLKLSMNNHRMLRSSINKMQISVSL